MIRFFLLNLVFVVTLFATQNTEILKRANHLVKSLNKSDQVRAYNDFKNLYLRSILNKDVDLKLDALNGIIKSGKKLHIDVSRYSYEYKIAKKTHKKYRQKKRYKKNIYVSSTNELKSATFESNRLYLTFSKVLKKSDIKHFTLSDDKIKKYKYIFDIKQATLTRQFKLLSENVKRVRLAQFKSNIVRLVLEHNKKIKLKYKRDKNVLVITFPKNNASSKSINIISKYAPPKRLDRSKVIVIDAGHGGKDPGAVGYRDYQEKNVVLSVGNKLSSILRSRGFKVFMTRDRDKFIKLSKRTKYANIKEADIFVSIHANAVPERNAKKAHGIECYFLSKSRTDRAKNVAAKENSADMSDMNFYGKKSFLNTLSSHNIVASNKLAIDLQRGMLGHLEAKYKDVYDGGVREGPFWVLVGAQMPSVLVEVGFITNPKEAKRLVNEQYQKDMALGLANGIERYFLNN